MGSVVTIQLLLHDPGDLGSVGDVTLQETNPHIGATYFLIAYAAFVDYTRLAYFPYLALPILSCCKTRGRWHRASHYPLWWTNGNGQCLHMYSLTSASHGIRLLQWIEAQVYYRALEEFWVRSGEQGKGAGVVLPARVCCHTFCARDFVRAREFRHALHELWNENFLTSCRRSA